MTECLATSNCFDLTVSSIEIDRDLVIRVHNVAIFGDISLVERLLQEGVPVDSVDGYDQTALMIAARHNKTDVIRSLLQKGTDINKRNRYCNTPVHWATSGNSTEAIAILIEHGALTNITNDKGDKPIYTARRYERDAAVRMLEQL